MDDDFYEEDEPLAKIQAIIDRGPDGLTERPIHWPQVIEVGRGSFDLVQIIGSRIAPGNQRVDTANDQIN